MMTMMEKNRFGVNMTIFVFLLSLLAPCASLVPRGTFKKGAWDVDVSYTKVDATQLETVLDNKISQAIRQDKKFYIGVAKKPNGAKATIQALCARQGKPNAPLVPATATSCPSESTHHRDIKSEECGFKLTEVFYADDFKSKKIVCDTEMSLIATYYNNCRVDPLCLNRQVGNDNCIQTKEGIVYLRIYK